MATPKERRPDEGPRSYDALDRAILGGFVNPAVELPFGQRKVLASRLRMRMSAVGRWISDGKPLSGRDLATELKVSDRCISNHFPNRTGLYAFPPPELAVAMVGASAPSRVWSDIALSIRPVFAALDSNVPGRRLLADLVVLHRTHTELVAADGYFSVVMRDGIRDRREVRTLAIVGLYTDGLRLAFEEWFDAGEPSMMFVADRVGSLIVGPVQDAFESLSNRSMATDE